MLFLHVLPIFLFCTSAIALPGVPLKNQAGMPHNKINIPEIAQGRRYYRFITPSTTPAVPTEYINDVMFLRKGGDKNSGWTSGMAELWQLTDTPGVLTGGEVLHTAKALARLKGDWVRYPTAEIQALHRSEMIHVDVGTSTFDVTCDHLVQVSEGLKMVSVKDVIGYYYHSEALFGPVDVNDVGTVENVLQINSPPMPRFQLSRLLGKVRHGEAPVTVELSRIVRDAWSPFPVAIHDSDVEKLETRNRLFYFSSLQGEPVAGFKIIGIEKH